MLKSRYRFCLLGLPIYRTHKDPENPRIWFDTFKLHKIDSAAMTSSLTSLLLVVTLWLGATIVCCNGGSSSQTDNPLTPAQRAEAKAAQDKACNTVSRLKSAGGFTKIEGGYSGVTHAYVDRGFFGIPVTRGLPKTASTSCLVKLFN